MKERKTPQQKKALSYKKDRVVTTEYPHAFRRNWPRKKAFANRAYRRRIHQAVVQYHVHEGAEEFVTRDPATIRRRPERKWGPPTALCDVVVYHLQTRIHRIGWNFFKSEYDSARHQQQFIRFLQAQIAGKTGRAREIARFFNSILQPRELDTELEEGPWLREWSRNSRAAWLAAFFGDEPDWEPRLRAWIRRLLSVDESIAEAEDKS